MAGLCWISVLLAVSLSIGNCEPLDISYVERIFQPIWSNYLIKNRQFCVAVNIPEDPKQLAQAFPNINKDTMENEVLSGKVYKGSNAVVAIPLTTTSGKGKEYTDHAEARVLDNIKNLANHHEGKILVLYSYLSPCGAKCTSEKNNFNILKKIRNNVKGKWKSYAFVFTKVFKPPKVTLSETDIKGALCNLRNVMVDDNIFRCFPGIAMKCIKCFEFPENAEPVQQCVENKW